MSFLTKLFNKMDDKNLMDKAPYLSPWYLHKDKPQLLKADKYLEWNSIGNHGFIELNDEEGNCYGIFGMVSYILSADDGKSFLVWHRDLKEVIGLQSINIYYYEVEDLKAVVDKEKVISEMEKTKQKFLFSVNPKSKVQFQVNPSLDEMRIEFPNDFKKFNEFIFITELQNLYDNPNPKDYWHNTTMLLVNTNTGWIYNYPQDWFNKSQADFMYQWITRAIRNPETNLIHGQGVRLPDFVLDKTNREILYRK